MIDKRDDSDDVLIPHDDSTIFGLASGPEAIKMVKRDAVALPLPSYVSQYSEKEVSSACSCMTITQPIESATATAPPTVLFTFSWAVGYTKKNADVANSDYDYHHNRGYGLPRKMRHHLQHVGQRLWESLGALLRDFWMGLLYEMSEKEGLRS